MSGGHGDAALARQVRAVEDLLIERGHFTDAQLDRALQRFLARATPANGAQIVARAWSDPAFKQRLLADGEAALGELGLASGAAVFRVLESTATEHHVVVCTLCSCYPVRLLGPPPPWYKSEAYRARVVREPRAVLAEFGLALDEEVDVQVWDASAETRYMVLPRRPAGTDGQSEEALAQLVTRNGLIGTATV